MKSEQWRDLTRPELLQKHHDLVEELFNLRLRKRVQEINNPLQLRTLRRELARIETVLREDDLGIRPMAKAKESS
jgi:large subunit ribosomal protein L29